MSDTGGQGIVRPVVEPEVRELCKMPYPNHKRGCPNYAAKNGCPPDAPMINDTLDLSRTIYVIYNIFPFGEHVEKMRQKHSEWSQRQKECCLYWQGTARKQLRGRIGAFLLDFPGVFIVMCPEAQGVNLTATMMQLGLRLEWPPKELAYQIVLAGTQLTVSKGG